MHLESVAKLEWTLMVYTLDPLECLWATRYQASIV